MKRLKLLIRHWLFGDEIIDMKHQLVTVCLRLDFIQKECAETNYDRWRETRKQGEQIKQIALRLALDDIASTRPEDN